LSRFMTEEPEYVPEEIVCPYCNGKGAKTFVYLAIGLFLLYFAALLH